MTSLHQAIADNLILDPVIGEWVKPEDSPELEAAELGYSDRLAKISEEAWKYSEIAHQRKRKKP